ncbi:MAG: PA0069 family radical SAM protein [Pseudomonadota bacterium]
MFYSFSMSIGESHQIPEHRRRGRAASGNDTGRFEPVSRVDIDDGWGSEDPLPPVRTEVSEEQPRRVITRNQSPDVPFDRSINPYRGCEHGCIYCFARPTHAFLGRSPGLDFETKVIARPDAPELLVKELARKSYTPKPLAIGTNTDPYQPIERDRRIMRRLLEVLRDLRHPVTIATKGSLVERDIDILAPMAAAGLAQVGIGVTTLDRGLARRMEPRVPAPRRRLATIRALAEAGIPVRVMASPIIPGLTDHEVESILTDATEAGACAASMILLRLPLEVAPLFQDWLAEHAPGKADKIMNRLREAHGGKLYDPRWGHRMRGNGVHSDLLFRRFEAARRRLGLAETLPPLDCSQFTRPALPGDVPDAQLSLF